MNCGLFSSFSIPSRIKNFNYNPILTQADENLTNIERKYSFKKFIDDNSYLNGEEVISFFKENFLNSSYFSTNKIPNFFDEISDIIQKDFSANYLNSSRNDIDPNNEEIINLINLIFKFHNILNEDSNLIKMKLGQYGRKEVEKFDEVLLVAIEYISCFYFIEYHENDETILKFKRRILKEEDLVKSFEALQWLKDIEGNEAIPYKPDLERLKNKNEIFNETALERNVFLSLEGIQTPSPFQRFFSVESIGVLIFSFGLSAPNNLDPVLPGADTVQKVAVLFISSLSTMFGFSSMTTSSKSIMHKLNLQKKLFLDMSKVVIKNKKNINLSHKTRLEFNKLLNNYPSLNLNFSTEIDEDPEDHIPSTIDIENLFHEIMESPNLTYAILHSKIKNNIIKNSQSKIKTYLDYFKTKVIKRNEVWGTLLDHMFSKMEYSEKLNFIQQLKNEKKIESVKTIQNQGVIDIPAIAKASREEGENLFDIEGNIFRFTGFNNEVPPTLEDTANKIGAINYVYKLIKETNWSCRKEGTRIFSKLVMDIYSSNLKDKDKQFLFKNIIQKELAAGAKGNFASGNIKRSNKNRNMLIGSLYTLSGITSFIFSDILGFLSDELGDFLKNTSDVISSGVGAAAFGFLGLNLHLGKTASHLSKEKMVEEALFHLGNRPPRNLKTLSNEKLDGTEFISLRQLNESNSVYDVYENFIQFLDAFKKFKSTDSELSHSYINYSHRMENFKSSIHNFILYFNEKGIAKFVYESKHLNMSCPLFDIIESLLDTKKLNKILEFREDMDISQLQVDKEYYEFVESVICNIYKNENIEELKIIFEKLNVNIHNMSDEDIISLVDEDIFSVFLSEGYDNAASPKDKFIFSLQCNALLQEIALYEAINNRQNTKHKSCQNIFIKAVKNVTQDYSSFLFDLQKQNEKTYGSRRVLARFIINVLKTMLKLHFSRAVIAGMLACPPSSSFAFISTGFFWAILSAFDFAARKYVESLQYKTRITLCGFVIKKSHRYYEMVRKLFDMREYFEQIATVEINRPSSTQVLKKVSKYNLKSNEAHLDILLNQFNECLPKNIKELDQAKITNNLQVLRKKIDILLQQGFDKDSVQLSIIRAMRLIILCNQISLDKRILLLSEIAYRSCIDGIFTDILKKNGMYARGWNLKMDAFLGFAINSFDWIQYMPVFAGVFHSPDLSQNATQHFNSFLALLGINFSTNLAWTYEIDSIPFSRTQNYIISLGAMKNLIRILKSKLDDASYGIAQAEREVAHAASQIILDLK